MCASRVLRTRCSHCLGRRAACRARGVASTAPCRTGSRCCRATSLTSTSPPSWLRPPPPPPRAPRRRKALVPTPSASRWRPPSKHSTIPPSSELRGLWNATSPPALSLCCSAPRACGARRGQRQYGHHDGRGRAAVRDEHLHAVGHFWCPCESTASVSFGSGGGGGGGAPSLRPRCTGLMPTRFTAGSVPRRRQQQLCRLTGLLCGTCEADHYRRNGVCNLCDEDATPSLAVYGGGAVLALLAGFIYMLLQLRAASSPPDGVGSSSTNEAANGKARVAAALSHRQRPRGACSALLAQLRRRTHSSGTIGKILLAYFQVLNAFSQLQHPGQELFKKFLVTLAALVRDLLGLAARLRVRRQCHDSA